MKFSQTVKKTGSFGAVNKQIRFATALALTRTAQDGQAATIASLKKNFDIRTDWLEPSRKFGIRIKPAKKNDLTAEIKTAADWLIKFEQGDEKYREKNTWRSRQRTSGGTKRTLLHAPTDRKTCAENARFC